jgi:hypothetical protein
LVIKNGVSSDIIPLLSVRSYLNPDGGILANSGTISIKDKSSKSIYLDNTQSSQLPVNSVLAPTILHSDSLILNFNFMIINSSLIVLASIQIITVGSITLSNSKL